jgi:hypothetical protein
MIRSVRSGNKRVFSGGSRWRRRIRVVPRGAKETAMTARKGTASAVPQRARNLAASAGGKSNVFLIYDRKKLSNIHNPIATATMPTMER